MRVVVNKDEKKVEAAQKLIEAGNQSDKSWEEAAKKYSSDPTTKGQGGLQKAITEEFVKGELKKAIFDGATGELNGPVEFEKNFLLIEPVKINPAKVKTLAEVKSQVSQTLTEQKQQEFFNEFVAEFQTKWPARTLCAKAFEGERCSNSLLGAARQSPRSDRLLLRKEADTKAAKEREKNGCQAPVLMTTPAIPGTVRRPTARRTESPAAAARRPGRSQRRRGAAGSGQPPNRKRRPAQKSGPIGRLPAPPRDSGGALPAPPPLNRIRHP